VKGAVFVLPLTHTVKEGKATSLPLTTTPSFLEINQRRKGQIMFFINQKKFFQTVQVLLSLLYIIEISPPQERGEHNESRKSQS